MKLNNKLIIAIDFDGTCVTHEYPRVGKDVGAVPVLKRLVSEGHKLMLWTMRGTRTQPSDTLQDAVLWFKENGIQLWGINENPEQKSSGWTNSNKQYAQLYIDDAALGCPLLFNPVWSDRPFVNWVMVETMLEEQGILTPINREQNGNEINA
jgi:hypothetical protein